MWKKTILRVVIGSVLAVGGGTAGVVGYKMVGEGPANTTAQGTTKPLTVPGEPDEAALARRLQEDCAKEPLRGVWVEKAEVIPADKLVLHGLLDRRPQAEAVAERARTLLGEIPTLAAKCPNGVGTAAMEVLPIHDRLKALQDAWNKPPLDPALRQTRLDGAYYSAPNRLHVSGVTLAAAGDVAEKVRGALRGQLETEPERAATKGEDKSKVLDIDVQLKALPNPAGPIEEAALKAGTLPGLALADAWYDAAGRLRFRGVLAREQDRRAFQELALAELARPESAGVVRPESGWSAEGLQVIVVAGLPQTLQKTFAAGDNLLKKTRLDGATLRRHPLEGLRLEFAGVCIASPLELRGQDLQTRLEGPLTKELAEAVKKALPEEPPFTVALAPGFVFRPTLEAELQEAVSRDPEHLRAVFVSSVTFDETGRPVVFPPSTRPEKQQLVVDLAAKMLGAQPPAPPPPPGPPGGEEEEAEGLAGEEPPCDKGEELENYETVLPELWKDMASSKSKKDVPAKWSHLHLDNITPVTVERKVKDKEGKEIDGKVNTFRVTGVWLYDGTRPTDEERKAFNDYFKDKVKVLLKPYFSADLQAEIDKIVPELELVESPLARLREAATGKDLDGAVFLDASFEWDDTCKASRLHVSGLYDKGKEEAGQLAKVKKLLGDPQVVKPAAFGKRLTTPQTPNLEDFTAFDYTALRSAVQQKFAEAKNTPQALTKVTEVVFRNVKDKSSPVLFGKGICLLPKGGDVQDKLGVALKEAAGSVLKKTIPEARFEADFEGNPVLALQAEVAADPRLDGFLVEAAQFNGEGKLKVQVRGDKDQEADLKERFKKIKWGGVEAEAEVEAADWLPRGTKWSAIPRTLQAKLAAEKDDLPRQTRVDRLYFAYDGPAAALRLHVEGVCIYEKTTDKWREELQPKLTGYLKDNHAALLQAVEKDETKQKQVVDASQVKSKKFPADRLQQALNEAKPPVKALINDAYYDENGTLRLDPESAFRGLTDASKDRLKAILERELKSTGIYAAPATEAPAPQPEKKSGARRGIAPAGRGGLAAEALVTIDTLASSGAGPVGAPAGRGGISVEGLVPIDWDGLMGDLRRQLAADRVEPLFRQTRVDDAEFRYDAGDRTPHLHFQMLTLLPPGNRATLREQLEKKLDQFFRERLVAKLPRLKFKVVLPDDAHLFLTSPVVALQAMAVDQHLDDALFEDAVYDEKGRLHLRVYLGGSVKPAQIAALIATPAAWEALKPALGTGAGQDREELDTPRPFPWRGEGREGAGLRERLQARFAASDVPAAWQTRVDRAYFLYDKQATRQMHLEGVSLWVGVPRATLAEALTPVCREVLPEPAYQVVADRVARKPNPAPSLQDKVAGKPEFDGILFEDAGFDARGRLIFPVVTADSDAQRAEVRRLLQAPPLADGILPVDPERRAVEVVSRTFDWEGMLKAVRAWAAGPTAPAEARRTRLDRAYFTREDGGGQLQLVGATLLTAPEGDPAAATAVRAKVSDSVGKRCLEHLRPLKLRLPEEPRPLARAVVPARRDLRAVLRGVIAAQRSLDGVNVTDVVYDGAGKVALEGHWLGTVSQARELGDVLRDALLPEDPVLSKYGTTPERLRVVRTDLLLRDLRKWLVDKTEVEEVLFDRLYFDAAGKMRIDGFFTRTNDREPAEKAGLEGLLAYPIGRALLGLDPDGIARPALEGKDVIHLVKRASLVEQLRAQVAADPTLDGIRIDRCWYDADAVFVLNGLEDAAGQSRELKELLGLAQDGAAFKAHLAAGWRLGQFTVVPLRKMLSCLTRMMPADPVYDGVTLDRAYHDAANHLVITGAITKMDYPGLDQARMAVLNQRREAQARKALAAAITADPNWRLRLSFGGPDLVMKAPPADLVLAERSFERAGQLYGHERKVARAVADLDTAIFNNPADATAWYFRAVCELALGDDAAARRDLRRVLAFAGGKPPLVEKVIDYSRLELVQGINRATASQTGQKLSFAVPADQSAAALMKDLCEEPLKAPVPDEAPGWDTPFVPRTPPCCGPPCWLPR